MAQKTKQGGGGSASGRFPCFSEKYRARWIGSGQWQDRTLHDLFDATVAAKPDKVALVTKDQKVTFKEWKERADALAAGLVARGIGKGDLVTVQLPNWVEFCYLQIALSRIGAVIQPLHVTFREREMRNLLSFCESDAVVVPGEYGKFSFIEAVRAMRGDLPKLRTVVVARGASQGEGEVALDALIEAGRGQTDVLKATSDDPDQVFYMNFTSGTEGDPKGFMHTHNSLISYMNAQVSLLALVMPDATILTCSPLTHSFGHFIAYFAALGGLTAVLIDRYRPLDVLELVQREKVTFIAGTPAHLIGMLQHPDFEKYDTSSIKSVMTGGARSAPEFIESLERTWGVKASNTYGLGENIVHTQTVATDPPEKVRETVGRPVYGQELKIVNPDDRGQEMPTGEVGEIAFRGPTLFVGYHRQPELTAQTRDDEGWFYTGDLGFVDPEGYLHFASRRSEVINRGGTKIYPKEIEDLLFLHPKVANSAVVGMPDYRLGERVCAYVVPQPGATVTLEEIAEFLEKQQVSKRKIPEHLVVVEELPMTPTGKVRKVALQDDIAKRAAELGS